MDNSNNHTYIEMTADIVSAFVRNNPVRTDDLSALIFSVHQGLMATASEKVDAPLQPPSQAPAVPVRKSVTNDYLICLEDGKKFKSLKRHLAASYNMTPDQYRAKWKLRRDYPMVAPSYSAERSALAKEAGLGSSKRGQAATPYEPVPADEPASSKHHVAAKQAKAAVEGANVPGAAIAPPKRRGRLTKVA